MPVKCVNFLKSRLIFNIFVLLFLNVCKQTFHISHVRISQKLKDVLMWNRKHIFFIVKTKILANPQFDFQIRISVPLSISFSLVLFSVGIHKRREEDADPQLFRFTTLLKRDSNRGLFLLNLSNFWEHLFWGTSANDCFYSLSTQWCI